MLARTNVGVISGDDSRAFDAFHDIALVAETKLTGISPEDQQFYKSLHAVLRAAMETQPKETRRQNAMPRLYRVPRN